MINFNDIVKVTDSGHVFTSNKTWATKHGMINYRARSTFARSASGFKVIAIGECGEDYAVVYGIESLETGNQYMIGDEGIELMHTAPVFDINAPIEQQFTRDGRKVIAIMNTGMNIKYPIAVVIGNSNAVAAFTLAGRFVEGKYSDSDIITKPALKPLVSTYTEHYLYTNGRIETVSWDTLQSFNNNRDTTQPTLKLQKIIYNPNSGEVITTELTFEKEA